MSPWLISARKTHATHLNFKSDAQEKMVKHFGPVLDIEGFLVWKEGPAPEEMKT